MPSTVTIKWNEPALSAINTKTNKGLFKMAFDIAAQARTNAPYVTGALRATIRVEEISEKQIAVIAGGRFGNKKVAYAWKREQGPNRNPATEHYMKNAQNLIMSGNYMKKYFGDIT